MTRYRTTLLDDRTRVVNRVHKVLEDTNIKLSRVASDILGASGRDMLQALIDGFLPLPLEHHLDAVPGVAQRTIEVLIAELGSDVKPFPTSSQAASWVGLVPTNEQSAGKTKRRRIKPRKRWLKRALVESARAASRVKNSDFSSQYARLASRRGHNRAAIAVAHSLLSVLYELLKHSELTDQDLDPDDFDKRDPERLRRHSIKRLQALGDEVTITPPTAS